MSKALTIGIADATPILADTLSVILSGSPGYKVLFTATSGDALLKALQKAKHIPDLLIMDTALSLDGFNVVEAVRNAYPSLKLLFQYEALSQNHLFWLIRMGGRAFCSCEGNMRQLLKAIDAVAAAGYYFSGEFTPSVLRTVTAISARSYPSFTPNEYRLMPVFCLGWSYHEISKHTGLSERVLRREKEKIFNKTPVHNISELIRFCNSHGIFPYKDMFKEVRPSINRRSAK